LEVSGFQARSVDRVRLPDCEVAEGERLIAGELFYKLSGDRVHLPDCEVAESERWH
jgi:hypothetical protein